MGKLALGIMSGTSGDGVSLALAEFEKKRFELIHYDTYPYPLALRKQLMRIRELDTAEVSQLHAALGHFFAVCARAFLKKARVPVRHVQVVGSHGHTFYHGPRDKQRNTLQLGEAAFLAEHLPVPVVSDFRSTDLAAGGEAAPLIPCFDQFFFGGGKVRALQNIGGTSNVTFVGKGLRPLAFDNGPGNTLIDGAMRKATRGKLLYDRDGAWARRGRIDFQAIGAMMKHPYFKKKPPKSTGPELFNERFLPATLKRKKAEDIVSTLTYFTAHVIHDSYRRFVAVRPREIIVSGGGVCNLTLLFHLQTLFSPGMIRSIEDFRIPAQAKEPLAFAFLALRALEGKINHLPDITGARGPRVLGKISRAYARR